MVAHAHTPHNRYKTHDRDPVMWNDGMQLVFRCGEATEGCGDTGHCPNQFCPPASGDRDYTYDYDEALHEQNLARRQQELESQLKARTNANQRERESQRERERQTDRDAHAHERTRTRTRFHCRRRASGMRPTSAAQTATPHPTVRPRAWLAKANDGAGCDAFRQAGVMATHAAARDSRMIASPTNEPQARK